MLFAMEKTAANSTSTRSGKSRHLLMRAEIALSDAIPEIVDGYEYPYVSGGDWSTHDLIFHMLKKIGPAKLTAATWSISEAAALKISEALASGILTEIAFLVDWRVQVRTPSFLAIAKKNKMTVRVTSCHAKAFVLQNEKHSISVVGSANFTNNPRIEAGHISTNPDTAAFHAAWILDEIAKKEPFGVDMRKRGKKDGRT